MVLHSAPFLFLELVDKAIHLTVFLAVNVISGFCIISYAGFQSCLLIPFKGVILMLKPYIVLYTFILADYTGVGHPLLYYVLLIL